MTASLLIVLVLAKLIVLVGRGVPLSGWAPVAYFWQDVAIVLAFGLFTRAVMGSTGSPARRSRVVTVRVVYASLVGYVALNVPVMLVLATPLTPAMLRGARGALADSIRYYLTPANLGSMAAVVAIGTLAPIVRAYGTTRVRRTPFDVLSCAAALLFISIGVWASARVDTLGFERNALTALIPKTLPAVAASSGNDMDWRVSFDRDTGAAPDLSGFRGTARGFNVLTVVLESTAARYLRPYGAALDPMPNLTALSQRALLFENAYAVYPESIKGLFSTLCARYPAFGVSPESHAAAGCDAGPRLLKAAGYHTAMFHSGRFRYLGMQELIADKGFDVLEDAGAIGGNEHSSFGVDEPSTVARLLRWIDSVPRGERFMAAYLPVAGHHPYATSAPGPFPSTTEASQYLNALHDGDAALGTLFDGLRARGLDRNTMVIVYGDHGEGFGQHPGNAGHTFFIFDENVRVPLLIALPGVTPHQARVAAVTSLIDVVPTMLDLLGLPASGQHQGVSALQPGARMSLFFTDYSLGWLGLRDGCRKYLYEIGSGRSKLFDVCRDPDELNDASALDAARVAHYRERVERWAAATKAAIDK